MQTEDGQIISRCLNGDTAMFGILVDKYKEGIYALAYSKLGNFHDAQDIAQETFIKAYRKLRTLRHWDRFGLWLSTITNNLCKDLIKSRAKRPDREFAEDQSSDIVGHNSMDSYRDDLMDNSLHEALDSLPQVYRQVLMLHYLSGYKNLDIARLLGVSPRTVVDRLRVGRERLKEEMISMMSATLKEQRLPAGFTFNIVEMVKRIRINPITQSKGLPWGLSLATGIIVTIFCLNPYMHYFSQTDIPAGAPLPSETRILKTGEIPVDILKTDRIMVISSKVEKGKGEEAKKNTLLLAPQGEDGTWTKKADMPTAMGALSASVVNGKIYAIGGCKTWAGSSSVVEEYDPAENKWAKKVDMPTARASISTAVVKGKIYAIGGWDGSICISKVEEYDPKTDTWTRKADMPTARGGHSASELNGKIYAIGGRSLPGIVCSTIEEYDPATDTWTQKVDMPTARFMLISCVVNGKVYAIGGVQDWQGNGLSTVEKYDPITDTWTKMPNMLTARFWLTSSVVNGKIYAIGGVKVWAGFQIFGPPLSTVEEYIPEGWPFAVFPQSKQPKTWGRLKGR